MKNEHSGRPPAATPLVIPDGVLEVTGPAQWCCGLVVCGTCGRSKGAVYLDWNARTSGDSVEQTCRCGKPAAVKWPRYDFNLAFEICRCCGQVLLSSGSRWSVWFCNGCKELVLQLNASLGRYAIPIGRHSFHGRLMLVGVPSAVDVEIFTTTFRHVTEAIDVVDEWSGLVVRRILEERWKTGPCDVPIREYLARCDPGAGERKRRFDQMLGFLSHAR
jgi:hypothetical protein